MKFITFDFLFLFEAPLLPHRNDQSDEEEDEEDHQVAPPYHRVAQQVDLQLVAGKELTLQNRTGNSMNRLILRPNISMSTERNPGRRLGLKTVFIFILNGDYKEDRLNKEQSNI